MVYDRIVLSSLSHPSNIIPIYTGPYRVSLIDPEFRTRASRGTAYVNIHVPCVAPHLVTNANTRITMEILGPLAQGLLGYGKLDSRTVRHHYSSLLAEKSLFIYLISKDYNHRIDDFVNGNKVFIIIIRAAYNLHSYRH